jgi:hypothetical protein
LQVLQRLSLPKARISKVQARTHKGKVVIMARKKKRSGRRGKKGSIVTLGAAFVPTAVTASNSFATGQGARGALINSVYELTAYNMNTGKFELGQARAGQNGMILLGGIGVSIVGKKLGLNRYVPKFMGYNFF